MPERLCRICRPGLIIAVESRGFDKGVTVADVPMVATPTPPPGPLAPLLKSWQAGTIRRG